MNPDEEPRLPPPGEWLQVGEYQIVHLPHGGFWLRHRSGEGMMVLDNKLERLIDDFFQGEF